MRLVYEDGIITDYQTSMKWTSTTVERQHFCCILQRQDTVFSMLHNGHHDGGSKHANATGSYTQLDFSTYSSRDVGPGKGLVA